jgi:hypothetical protein
VSPRATRVASYYIHRATCAKAQAAHRRGPRLLANRRLRRFRSGAVEKMTGDHPRNTGPMLPSLRCGAKAHAVGQALRVSGGKRRKALPNAWGCAGVRRSARQQERAEARPLYARSHRGTPATAGAAVVSIVARGQGAGSGRAGLVEQPTWYSRLTPKGWFGWR